MSFCEIFKQSAKKAAKDTFGSTKNDLQPLILMLKTFVTGLLVFFIFIFIL
jgi:hypothetical protein